MHSVLVISRYFPPIGSAGASIRITKIIKYAAQDGWSFIVLTQDPNRPVIPEKQLSSFLLDELPTDLRIIRVPSPFSNQNVIFKLIGKIFKESSLPWGVCMAWKGWKLLRERRVDLIYVNTPPFTNVAIGAVLGRIFQIPLVIDFKDDWVGSSIYYKKNKLRKQIESWIERAMVRQAKAVFIVTEASYEAYTQRYASEDQRKKIHFIPNGQDLDEYKVIENRERQITSEKFMLLSAAAGYRKDYRDLTPFIEGLDVFLNKHPDAMDNLEIVFLGDAPENEYLQLFKGLVLEKSILVTNATRRQEFVEWLWKADLLFLIQPKGNSTAISGTLYEYWATGKAPILLMAEKGASSSLIEINHLGQHFLFTQTQELADYLGKIYNAYCSRKPVWINRQGVEQYNRKILIKKMTTCWSEILPARDKLQ